MCLDRTDGSQRWKRELDRAHPTEVYPANDSASPTPVTDGANVYAFFPELGLVSFDAAGELRWTHPLGPFVSFYGMSSSPILAGDMLIQLCDQQQGSFLLAVDAKTGEELWKTERTGMIECWTTPVLFPADSPTSLIVLGTYFLCGYDLETGAETWRRDGLGYTPVCSPLVDGDRVFASVPNHAEQPMPSFDSVLADSDEDEDGKLTKAEVEGSWVIEHFGWVDANKDDIIDADEWAFIVAGMSNRDYGLVAVDLDQQEDGVVPVESWRHKRSLPEIATPLLYDGVIYLAKNGGVVTSLDAGTGDVLKSERIRNGGSEFYPSPVAADGKVYMASNAGEVTVLKAQGEWEILAVNDIGEEIQASPAIADGALFIRTKQSLFCFQELGTN